jgi:putative transposase
VVGIFPNDASIVRLVGSQLLEQQEEWQLEQLRLFSEAAMAKIPQQEQLLDLSDEDPAVAASGSTSGASLTTSTDRHESPRLLSCTFSDEGS